MSSFSTQTAYQRWELASLIDDPHHQFRTMPPEIAKLAQEMVAGKEQAYQEAFEQGQTQGYSDGHSRGMHDGFAEAMRIGQEQQHELTRQIEQLLDHLGADVRHARERIANELLQLSFDMARAIVKTEITLNPSVLVTLIEQALLDIPNLQLPASIHVNPEDADLLESMLLPEIAADGWRLVRDTQIESGGCIIHTAVHVIDLQLATRWEKLHAQLELDPILVR